MDEQDFRTTLTKEELEQRAFIVPFKITDFSVLEQLNRYSTELEKTWDELINAAITKLLNDIAYVHNLRN